MNQILLLELIRHTLLVSLELSLPILLITLIVGVVISLFQAVTQIQEATLTFVPKVLALALALAAFGPWMLAVIVGFTSGLIGGVPDMLHAP